jgi:hypothetical protein
MLLIACAYGLGWKPVRLIADTKFVRAWPGGTGNSKVGGYVTSTPHQLSMNGSSPLHRGCGSIHM